MPVEVLAPIESNNVNQLKFNKWAKYPDGSTYPSDNISVMDNLETGIYNVLYNNQRGEEFLVKNDFIHDDLVFYESVEYDIIMKEVKSFWSKKNDYEKYNYMHKRGLLLEGAPGTGKTSLINLCLSYFFKEVNGLCFSIQSEDELIFYSRIHKTKIRSIEPSRPIITIFEDIDGYVSNSSHCESLLLNILDGNNSINNVLYIATTNYPEKLSDRIINRPGRFDVKVEIKFPSRNERENYLIKKMPNNPNISDWLDNTENTSFAYISEMVKQFLIYEKPLNEILKNMAFYKSIAKTSTSFNKEEKQIGFTKQS